MKNNFNQFLLFFCVNAVLYSHENNKNYAYFSIWPGTGKDARDAAKEKIDEISATGETPEIDGSASQRSNGIDNDGVNTGETYEENESGEDYTMETTDTPQTNHGEDLDSVNGFNFSIYGVLLSFGNVSVLILK